MINFIDESLTLNPYIFDFKFSCWREFLISADSALAGSFLPQLDPASMYILGSIYFEPSVVDFGGEADCFFFVEFVSTG